MNMVIKCLLAALWLLAVPWAAGGTVFYKSKKKSMGMYLLAGYLLMFSVAELMILPMMWAKLSLHILEYSFAGVMAVAAVAGFIFMCREKRMSGNGEKKHMETSVYFWIAAVLIIFQLAVASFLAHMDADDAFYVATATTSVHTDTIFFHKSIYRLCICTSAKQIRSVAVSGVSCSGEFSLRISSGDCGTYDISGSIYFYGLCGLISVCKKMVP